MFNKRCKRSGDGVGLLLNGERSLCLNDQILGFVFGRAGTR